MDDYKLKSSRFCYLFKQDGVTALFHTLYVKTIFLNNITSSELLSLIEKQQTFSLEDLSITQQKIAERLFELGMLVTTEEDELNILQEISENYTGYPDIQILYLILTEACNLACRYCFIENAIPKQQPLNKMTESIAIASIDLFARVLRSHPDIKPSIIFYGGEPTINWDVLTASVSYIKSKIESGTLPINTEISLISNGTLLNQEKLEFIKSNNLGLSISIDGIGSNNDERVFLDGTPSINRVLKSYDMAQQMGLPVGISCTVTPTNVDNLNEVTTWMIEKQVASVGFNILMDTPNRPQVDPELVQKISINLTDAYLKLRENNIYEDRIGRKINTFINQEIYPFDCAGYGGQLVVAPDGAIGVCHAYLGEREFFVANVLDSKVFNPKDNVVFLEWSRRSPFNMPQCQDCPVLGICGGGCAKVAQMKQGSIWDLDERFCIHAKHTLEWMIWDLYQISLNQGD